MPFNAMRTVTVRQAESMGIDVAKFFGINRSYSADTLLLVMPTGDKDHPWEIVDFSPEDISKKEPEPEPKSVDTPYGNLSARDMAGAGQ